MAGRDCFPGLAVPSLGHALDVRTAVLTKVNVHSPLSVTFVPAAYVTNCDCACLGLRHYGEASHCAKHSCHLSHEWVNGPALPAMLGAAVSPQEGQGGRTPTPHLEEQGFTWETCGFSQMTTLTLSPLKTCQTEASERANKQKTKVIS